MDDLKDQKNELNESKGRQVTAAEREVLESSKMASEDSKEQISLVSRVAAVFISPKKGMEIASRTPMIIGMFVILVISAMLIYIPQRPMFLKMTMMAVENSNQSFSAEQIDTLIAGGANAAMFMSMFYFVCTPLFKGLVAFALAILMNGSGKLKSTIGVVMNAYVIMLIGQVIRMVIVLATGNPYFSLSPALFLPAGQETSSLFSLLSAMDLFAIWYLGVSMIGIKKVHELTDLKAFIVTFGPWLMMLALGVAGL